MRWVQALDVSVQVRLDDDVAAALNAPANKLSRATNDALRAALKLPPKVKVKRRSPTPIAPAEIPKRKRPPIARRPPARTARATTGCKHPIGRRLGTMCMQCGHAV